MLRIFGIWICLITTCKSWGAHYYRVGICVERPRVESWAGRFPRTVLRFLIVFWILAFRVLVLRVLVSMVLVFTVLTFRTLVFRVIRTWTGLLVFVIWGSGFLVFWSVRVDLSFLVFIFLTRCKWGRPQGRP